MRWIFLLVCVAACKMDQSSTQTEFLQAEQVQLSAPQFSLDSMLFKKQAVVEMKHGYANTNIHYALDGDDVLPHYPIWDGNLTFKEDFSLQAKAYSKSIMASDAIQIEGRKYTDSRASKITSAQSAKAPYDSSNLSIFFDGQKGTYDFRSEKWLGFEEDSLEFTIQLEEERVIEEVILSTLHDEASWIMNPSRIEVSIENKLRGTFDTDSIYQGQPTQLSFWDISVVPSLGDELYVKVIGNKLPEWHPGKGKTGWLFIDEILIR